MFLRTIKESEKEKQAYGFEEASSEKEIEAFENQLEKLKNEKAEYIKKSKEKKIEVVEWSMPRYSLLKKMRNSFFVYTIFSLISFAVLTGILTPLVSNDNIVITEEGRRVAETLATQGKFDFLLLFFSQILGFFLSFQAFFLVNGFLILFLLVFFSKTMSKKLKFKIIPALLKRSFGMAQTVIFIFMIVVMAFNVINLQLSLYGFSYWGITSENIIDFMDSNYFLWTIVTLCVTPSIISFILNAYPERNQAKKVIAVTFIWGVIIYFASLFVF